MEESEIRFRSQDRNVEHPDICSVGKDTEGIIRVLAEDIQGIATDVHETVQGETGLLTCRIEQDHTLSGTGNHVSAPTTVVFRQANGAWKELLFHTLPLPPESA